MKVTLLKGGDDFDSWVQPVCECGWQGSKHYAYSDYQLTNATQERVRHEQKCVGLPPEEPAKTEW